MISFKHAVYNQHLTQFLNCVNDLNLFTGHLSIERQNLYVCLFSCKVLQAIEIKFDRLLGQFGMLLGRHTTLLFVLSVVKGNFSLLINSKQTNSSNLVYVQREQYKQTNETKLYHSLEFECV